MLAYHVYALPAETIVNAIRPALQIQSHNSMPNDMSAAVYTKPQSSQTFWHPIQISIFCAFIFPEQYYYTEYNICSYRLFAPFAML